MASTGELPVSQYPIARLRHTVHLLQEDNLGLNRPRINFENYMSLDPEDAMGLLRGRLANLITGLSVLDTDGPYGIYNRHDFVHIESVNRISHTLLDNWEEHSGERLSKEERNIATAIAFCHDIGNNIQRKNHGLISVKLFDKLFDNYDLQDPQVMSVLMGIAVHDEPFGSTFSDTAGLADLYPDLYLRPIWSTVAADKLDVGRHRLSATLAGTLPTTFEKIIEEVPHTLIVLYPEKSTFSFPQDQEAVWDIEFSTVIDETVHPSERAALEQFIWKGKDLYVPHEWHRIWKEQNIPYTAPYLGMMEQAYCTRLAIMFSCLYGLFPNLDEFRIQVRDDREFIMAQSSTTYTRETWQETLFMTWKKQHESAYESGTVAVPEILKEGERRYRRSKQ